ncbi:MAG: alpha-glucan family phosphorylase [bacterium]|nr:alpha-glucan family phosphorylase [bacterium]
MIEKDVSRENGLFDKIDCLKDIFHNLYWTFHPEAETILRNIDLDLFEKAGQNPIVFLKEINWRKMAGKLQDSEISSLIRKVKNDFHEYLLDRKTWIDLKYPHARKKAIAYFSAEFGFHKSLPIYSGGLGILAGDHCCGASDLGLDLTGVGLLYKEGYVDQKVNRNGDQITVYPGYNFRDFPLRLIRNVHNEPLLIYLDFPGRRVYFQIWELAVGRIKLYLLDTDVDHNFEEDRRITSRLYGGDREMRISQEIVLGMGGVRALRKLDIHPSVWHINEGHSAFILLELAGEIMEKGKGGTSLLQALRKVRKKVVFTTHTPVKAGNETFAFSLMEKYFRNFSRRMNTDMMDLLEEGVPNKIEDTEEFNMTAFAIKNSAFTNAVSRLHQSVSRKMWQTIWPARNVQQVPIDYITNGVNIKKWLAPEWGPLFSRYVDKAWEEKIDQVQTWKKVHEIPPTEFWKAHLKAKERMIGYVIEKTNQFYKRNQVDIGRIRKIIGSLDPGHLYIGFGRRFTPYKRAALLFEDEKRLKKILGSSRCPVHFIFSGKAHPMDTPGKALIKKIYEYSLKKEYLGKILFIENYSINTARYMVTGCDVWLNNPRRPYEASGTSGQKAGANGVLNFSILDGWWPEAYHAGNGWAIGTGRDYQDRHIQDREDSRSLYQILEKKIIPLYYRKSGGYSGSWVDMMKESMSAIIPRYNIIRMVKEYFIKFYNPLM